MHSDYEQREQDWIESTAKLEAQLAAEVRKLRKDRERLDWLLDHCFVNVSTGTDRIGREIDERDDIDSAMAAEREAK